MARRCSPWRWRPTVTYGRWGKQALTWWRALAQQVARTDPHLRHLGAWAVPNLLQRWWAEVGVALQTANAEAIQGSLGVDPDGGGLSGAHPPLPHTLLLPSGAGEDAPYEPSEAPDPPEEGGGGGPGAGLGGNGRDAEGGDGGDSDASSTGSGTPSTAVPPLPPRPRGGATA